jgi:eukaryotic-like serine/threonine-protein kinase
MVRVGRRHEPSHGNTNRAKLNATVVPPKVCPTCGTRYAADAIFCPNDGTPLSSVASANEGRAGEGPDLYLGREISGHIEIRQLAGIGAMGRVYRAFQRGIERDVAVKILHRELSANPQLVARFHREAKVASRLSHPNVVQVHLAGQLPDGALYIVMEYLDGLSLQSALAASGGYMPVPRALHVALQICDAAGEAHSQGVVHRDLKPENVMLVRRGDDVDYVKVLDFGIARLNWGDQSMATAAGLIFGTARYISPEGAQGEAVGPAGDVYAIATLLYQMLSGRTPFEGDQAVALLVQQIHDPAPLLTSTPRGREVPDPIATAVMRNLAKRPADRAPDARVLGRLLIDAAKASGLSPEELVPRSVLLGSKQGPLHLPPLQRTRPIEVTPDVAARQVTTSPALGGASQREPAATSASGGGGQGTTRVEARGPSKAPATLGMAAMTGTAPILVPPTEGAHAIPTSGGLTALPLPGTPPQHPVGIDASPGTATTKWRPPADFQAHLAPKPSPNALTEPRQRVDSNVDETMDDDDDPQDARQRPQSEALAAPLTGFPRPSVPAVSPQPAPAVPRTRTEFGEPAFVGPSPPTGEDVRVTTPSAPAIAGWPASNVETTLSDEESAISPRRARSRAAGIIFLCFLVGAIVASGLLFKLDLLGPIAQANSIDTRVGLAEDAVRHKRWDSPPGDNVRDLTDDGLARWPKDPRLLDVRARAADELVKEALGRKFEGDVDQAVHLARLANQLDPTHTAAQYIIEEYEQADKSPPTETPTSSTADASIAPPHPGATRPAGPTPPQSPTAKVAIDAVPSRPHLGQPVAFSAKVANAAGATPRAIEDVHFKLNGPGLAPDTHLTAIADAPGTYRAAFTFFEAGKYELTFEARVDGVLVRTMKQVATGEEAPAGSASQALPPPPAPRGKWL